jgi:LuxR family maltose regulon positive regulatory protein
MRLLNRLSDAAEAGGRTGSLIEVLILRALAYQAQGEMSNAIATVKRALTLAEVEGYGRIFADEGQPMRTLLAASLAQGADPVYVTGLMHAIDPQSDNDSVKPSPNELLIEPLSNRELEVLALLVNGLSNQAIADELVIAISTVKKHVNSIFGKLGVTSRTQAVNRARELNIV